MYETTYILGGNIELEVEFNYTGPVEGYHGGPMEDAQQPEDEEIEITSVTCNGKPVETDDMYEQSGDKLVWIDHLIADFISNTRDDWMTGPEE